MNDPSEELMQTVRRMLGRDLHPLMNQAEIEVIVRQSGKFIRRLAVRSAREQSFLWRVAYWINDRSFDLQILLADLRARHRDRP